MEASASAQPDVWVILWPVIIGALLTLLPAILGQLSIHFLSQAAVKREQTRGQFLKFAAGVAEFELWLHNKTNEKAYGGPDPGPSPLPAVMAIAAIDFPVLLGPLDDLKLASMELSVWQSKAAMKRLRGQIEDLNEGFEEVHQPLTQQFARLNSEVRVVGVSLSE